MTREVGFARLGGIAGGALLLAGAVWAKAQPAPGWNTVRPEEVGLDSAALAEMFDFARERRVRIHSIQIVRRGKVALDAYFYPYAPGLRHDVASVTKSITSTLVGLASERGVLPKVEAPLVTVLKPDAAGKVEDKMGRITLKDLLTMQAGWDCGFEPKERRLFEMRGSSDWLGYMLKLPMVAEPGTRWGYCSGNCHVLSMLLTERIGTNALGFARRELWTPLGISDVAWRSDPRGNNHGWGDLQMHPLDMAKMGQLFLQGGRWNGRQIVSEGWVAEATRAHAQRTSNSDGYGYFWWVKGQDYAGMFEAVGRGGQRITVWPAKELVLVFTGGNFEPGDLAPFILKALKQDEALPRNDAAFSRLKAQVGAAQEPPTPRAPSRQPEPTRQVSGKTFALMSNGLSLDTLKLEFNGSAQAEGTLRWQGQDVNFPIGLDGVPRFANNPLVGLPQAAEGNWMAPQVFVLNVDLVGGINHYVFKLAFGAGGKSLEVGLTESSGLNEEQFSGVVLQ